LPAVSTALAVGRPGRHGSVETPQRRRASSLTPHQSRIHSASACAVTVTTLGPHARRKKSSHEQTVERIRSLHKLGLVIAERLAHGEPVYRQLPRGAVRRALESLRDAAIIERKGRGDWRFTNPLFRRYLATVGPFD
jgi:hypothetical protein